jgi:hypothetical protein
MRLCGEIEVRDREETLINLDPIQSGGRLTADAMKADIMGGSPRDEPDDNKFFTFCDSQSFHDCIIWMEIVGMEIREFFKTVEFHLFFLVYLFHETGRCPDNISKRKCQVTRDTDIFRIGKYDGWLS